MVGLRRRRRLRRHARTAATTSWSFVTRCKLERRRGLMPTTSAGTPAVRGAGAGSGPRATPTIEHGRVFTYGAHGHLERIDAATWPPSCGRTTPWPSPARRMPCGASRVRRWSSTIGWSWARRGRRQLTHRLRHSQRQKYGARAVAVLCHASAGDDCGRAADSERRRGLCHGPRLCRRKDLVGARVAQRERFARRHVPARAGGKRSHLPLSRATGRGRSSSALSE